MKGGEGIYIIMHFLYICGFLYIAQIVMDDQSTYCVHRVSEKSVYYILRI